MSSVAVESAAKRQEWWQRPIVAACVSVALIAIPALLGIIKAARVKLDESQTDAGMMILRIDDYFHFWSAGKAMLEGGDIYSERHGQNYIYPPMFAWLFQPLATLDQRPGVYIWIVIDAAILFAGVLLFAHELVKRLRDKVDWSVIWTAAAFGLLMLVDKVMAQFKLQQTDGVMLLAMGLALRWMDSRPLLAGVVLGVAGNVKYLSLIALPWFVVRRRCKAAAGTVVGFVACLIIPALTRGWDRNLADLKVAFAGLVEAFGVNVEHLPRATSHPITWERSVSITSTMFRAAEALSLGNLIALAATGLFALACVAIVWAAYRKHRIPFLNLPAHAHGLIALEWVGLLIASLTFGPQTTARHMIQLIPLFMLAWIVYPIVKPIWRRLFIVGCILLTLVMVLPPGGKQYQELLTTWRAIGVVSWVTLALFFTLFLTTLPLVSARNTLHKDLSA